MRLQKKKRLGFEQSKSRRSAAEAVNERERESALQLRGRKDQMRKENEKKLEKRVKVEVMMAHDFDCYYEINTVGVGLRLRRHFFILMICMVVVK